VYRINVPFGGAPKYAKSKPATGGVRIESGMVFMAHGERGKSIRLGSACAVITVIRFPLFLAESGAFCLPLTTFPGSVLYPYAWQFSSSVKRKPEMPPAGKTL
jgi:hypothetical protein